MPALVIHADRILTPLEDLADSVIIVEDGRITGVGHRDEVRVPAGAADYVARGLTAVPGFVDIHLHGAGGHDVMEAGPAELRTIARTLARFGTTSFVATTVTAPKDLTCRSLSGLARYIASDSNRVAGSVCCAEVLGIHLEGPFISPARRGVHPPGAIAKPSVPLLEKFFDAARGAVRILTLAPELPGALELVDLAVARGILVALGHTDATYAQACAAIEHGVRHAVHVFNAMRPFSHRETGVLGAVLTDSRVTAEIIADGVHVDAPAVQLLRAAKGSELVLLVTDATAATAMPDGKYRLGQVGVTVRGGVCRNREGKLAGSTLTLDRAVRHMVALGVPLLEAVQMATLHPARRLGIAGKKGILAAGSDADVVLLTPDLQISGVLARGVGLA
ncbi:MAG: N-acetylglucosamine-6-phosphate deacetylase [Candidatus Acidiferrales bacterium]